MKRFIEQLLNILLILLIVVLALLVVSGILQRLNRKNPYTGLFGVGYAVVVSESMVPKFHVNDMIVYSRQDTQEYKVGDIIVFTREEAGEKILITHRIIGITESGFITKGDANEVQDPKEAAFSDVVGKVRFSIPYLGVVTSFLRTPLGIALMALAAGLLFLLRGLVERHRKEEAEEK